MYECGSSYATAFPRAMQDTAPFRPFAQAGAATINVSSCAGFSDAEMSCSPHALPVGIGEAPRHEVAGGGAPAVQRALWGLCRGRHRWEGGLGRQDWAGPGAVRMLGESWTKGKGVQRSLGGRYEAGMRRIEASGIVAGG
jgi:hypothetical protein